MNCRKDELSFQPGRTIYPLSKPDTAPGRGGDLPMKNLILAAFAAIVLGTSIVSADATTYRAPANNYYQNNWMGR
jgi:hypothetical protein